MPKTATSACGTETARPREVESLAADLRLVVGRMARRLRQQVDEGVSASSLSALSTIDRLGTVSLGELAANERVQPPTITRIVASLEDARLVVRHADPFDRRIARIRLTAQGRKFVERTRTRREAYLAKALENVDADDRVTLSRAVHILDRMLRDSP